MKFGICFFIPLYIHIYETILTKNLPILGENAKNDIFTTELDENSYAVIEYNKVNHFVKIKIEK